jgi:3-deoxy-7-phosphoheptulonate synthase
MKDITQLDLERNIPLVSSVRAWDIDLPLYIAGPCTVESFEQMDSTAINIKKLGINYIRGGAYKPLTFPYRNDVAYELREEGISILREIKQKHGLKVVTEVTDVRVLDNVSGVADIIQIGARNMYNYPLLQESSRTGLPILLKRHFGASLRDWLGAAEYILKEGNNKVILCERGVCAPHTHELTSRFIADIQVIPIVKKITDLPIVIDASHATFNRSIVPDITFAGIAAGADGFIIEAHPQPEKAAVDPLNAISFSILEDTVNKCNKIRGVVR